LRAVAGSTNAGVGFVAARRVSCRAPRWRKGAPALAALVLAFVALGGTLRAARSTASQSTRPRALDTTRPLTYFIAVGDDRTRFQPTDHELAVWALGDWRRSSANALRFEPSNEADAIVRLYWADRSEGQFGEMQALTIGGRPGAAIYIRPDMESFGPAIARRAREDPLFRDTIVYLTCVHELGHALGLSHSRDFRDVMYYFGFGGDVEEFFGRYRAQLHTREDIPHVSGLSTGDVSQLRALYGVK
jgi:hypothetical protein